MGIHLLDSTVISRIAAGEVVERPASVVKELVENSLDAGSTQITVEIKSGGISFIQVTDDGSGIPDDQAETAFLRYATSKISHLEDLGSISSLGFRGEALPSIAAAAQVHMLTAEPGAASGTFLEIDEGKVTRHEKQARSPGTTITVQDLFHKIPARLKFLKSEMAEGSRVADVVTQYALAYPEVKFRLIVGGRNTLRTPGSGALIDSFSAVHGAEASRQMLEIKSLESAERPPDDRISVSGLVGSPRISRSTREFISLFVNRRWVTNRMLSFAVEEAYHGLLMVGKHPIAVINLGLRPDRIDVNVHPSKTEIKFQDERLVFSTVQRAVREVLVQSSPVPQIEESRHAYSRPIVPFTAAPRVSKDESAAVARPPEEESPAPTPLMSLPLLRVLGQLARSYIVAEGPEGLFIIDQHAAHERIQLEKIGRQRAGGTRDVQGLLEPVPLDLDPRQVEILKPNLNILRDLGFEIEAFGPHTFLVRAVPGFLAQSDWAAALRESLGTLSADWKEGLAITLACHSAIRAGQILNLSEMQEMIRQLEQTALPHSCPHGRPTMVQIPLRQFEKEFGRG